MITKKIPYRRDIEVVRGDPWAKFKFRWEDSNFEPVEVISARSQFRRNADSDTVLLEVELELDDDGFFHLVLTGEDTASLINCVYDVEVTPASGEPQTFVRGEVTVEPDVTR